MKQEDYKYIIQNLWKWAHSIYTVTFNFIVFSIFSWLMSITVWNNVSKYME